MVVLFIGLVLMVLLIILILLTILLSKKNGSAIYWNAMNGSVNNCYFTVKETGKYYVIYNKKNQLSLYITILLNLNMLFITWALLIV